MNMNNRTLSEYEAIKRIELLGGTYNPDSTLSLHDQLQVCESITESSPVISDDTDGRIILQMKEANGGNVNVNGSVNGSCKRNVNFELTQSKQNVILELTSCSYQTPPIEIAKLLEEFFVNFPSKEGHWLYVAQHWNPRTILRVIQYLIKLDSSGRVSLRNPAKYFTHLIKFRKRRRGL
jgi:hypothetical protein